MTFIFHTIIEVLKGVPNTLAVTLIAMCVGILIGSIFALIRFTSNSCTISICSYL